MYDHGGMNRFYRLVWSESKQAYVPIPEVSNKRGKRKGGVFATLAAAALALLASAQGALADPGRTVSVAPVMHMVAPPSSSPAPVAANALPTGGQVVGGQGTISTSGSTQTIDQTSQNLAIDWQSFNIGSAGKVIFNQPSTSSVALNRVLGGDASKIYGVLQANGQVFLVNPNGVLFAKGSQVSAAGIMASTRDMSVADFMNGKYVLSGKSSAGVVNQGTLNAGLGGYVVLVGASVVNDGAISAQQGDVRLAAADDVTIKLDNGGLLDLAIGKGAYDALVSNGGIIKADGGRIYLTADALDALSKASVSNAGIIEAQTVGTKNGRILLLGDMATGTVTVGGTLDASAPNGGDGGSIETSAAHVTVGDDDKITAASASGKTGSWRIDPTDFTIAASGGDMTGAALTTALGSADVQIQSSTGGAGTAGDINVNDAVSWSANTLTLTAANNININANMSASGTGKLFLQYGQATTAGAGTGYILADGVKIDLPDGQNFSTQQGSAGGVVDYTVITSLGSLGDTGGTTLQGIQGALGGNYVLGGDIDASATNGWDQDIYGQYQGFNPIGLSAGSAFSGTFDGLGHTISNLYIRRMRDDYVGLFSQINHAVVSNLMLSNASVAGGAFTGGVAGYDLGASVDHVTLQSTYVYGNQAGGIAADVDSGSVSHVSVDSLSEIDGNSSTGGIAGLVETGATLSDVTVAASVNASNMRGTGGIAGKVSDGTIDGADFSGTVSNFYGLVGGLVGDNYGTVENSTAHGFVYGAVGDSYGGAVGHNEVGGTVQDVAITAGASIQGSDSTGGLVGFNEGSISGGSVDLNVSVSGNQNVGGLIGNNTVALGNMSSAATVSGVMNVGGLIGLNQLGADLTNVSASGQVSATGNNTGGLVGYNDAVIDLSHASGNVQSTSGDYNNDAGGLVGFTDGDITNSHATGTVGTDVNGGGLVGEAAANLTNDYATGAVSTYRYTAGGLVGVLDSGTISGSNATGAVDGSMGLAGGLVGDSEGIIQNSYSTSNVTAADHDAGGLVGYNNGSISGSNATGTVHASFNAGGLVGAADGSSSISNSYATGAVDGGHSIGGLAGLARGTIDQSYATGSVTATDDTDGGLVGYNDATITDSHATGNVSGSNWIGGLIGENDGDVSGGYASGTVSGGGAVGGIVGWNAGSVSTTTGSGAVTGSEDIGGVAGWNSGSLDTVGSTSTLSIGATDVGGLVGHNKMGGTLSNSSRTVGSLSGSSKVGGLVGLNDGDISDSNSTINVTGDTAVGGLVGASSGSISGSNATGTAHADTENGGGLVGDNSGSIDTSYATGNVDGGDNLGGLAGNNSGIITGSHAEGTVHGIMNTWTFDGGTASGGLVGVNSGTISGSHATGDVTADSDYAGGLVGDNSGDISSSNASGTVYTDDGAGGAIGHMSSGTIDTVYATGDVTGYNGEAGGLVGWADGGNVGNSYATGTVGGGSSLGGFVGVNAATITNSNATGTVSGDHSIGGFAGANTGSISDSYATGAVSGNWNIGGFAGESHAELTGDYETGNVSGSNAVGGLVGYNDNSVTGTHADGTVSGDTQTGGLLGYNSGTLKNSSKTIGDVTSTGPQTGGLVGENYGLIHNSEADIAVTGTQNVGGAVGLNGTGATSGDLENVTATGIVIGAGQSVGGLVGLSDVNTLINDSTASGSVSNSDLYTGGLVGHNYAHITDSSASGAVSGTGEVGGLIGSAGVGNTWGSSVTGSFATGNITATGDDVGGFAGTSWGTVTDNYATGTVGGHDNVGGFVGYARGGPDFSDNYATGNVTGNTNVGGLVGKTPRDIWGGYASGTVNGASNVGGFVGYIWDDGELHFVSASGAVTATGNNAGGLAGFNDGADIADSSATGAVSGHDFVGGLAGKNSGYITDGQASGQVNGHGILGGLAGSNDGAIDDSSASGHVIATDSSVGGLVGVNYGDIGNAFSTGQVDSPLYGIGGLVGDNYATVHDSYSTSTVNGNTYVGGLVGYLEGSASVVDTHYAGTVTGSEYVGGLIGTADAGATISTSHSSGAVVGSNMTGGFIGSNAAAISDAWSDATVSGHGNTGGFVGWNDGSVADSHATGTVSGTGKTGGFVGVQTTTGASTNDYETGNVTITGNGSTAAAGGFAGTNAGLIEVAYANGSVSGATVGSNVGGLVGTETGTVTNAYATGNVTGSANVGGLFGVMSNGTATDVYAKGLVNASGQSVAGLVGAMSGGTITNGYWNMATTGFTAGIGDNSGGSLTGNGLTASQAKQQSSYAGFDFSTGGVWKNYNGDTTPLLTHWLTALTVTVNDAALSHVYDGTGKTDAVSNLTYSDTNAPSSGHLAGSLHYDTGKNVGTYTSLTGLYSDQQGYNITVVNTGSLAITPKAITVTGAGVNRTYDQTTAVAVALGSSGVVVGDDLSFSGTGTMADKNAGLGKSVSVTGISGSGADLANYTFNTTASASVDIAKMSVVVDGFGVNRTYNGATSVGVVLGSDGILSGDTVAFSGTGAMADKNAGTGKSVAVSGIAASGADAQNYAFNTTASTTVDIAKLSLEVEGTGVNKTYDGSTSVGVVLGSDGVLSGDTVAFSGTGTMADKNAGTDKGVAISGIAASGADAGNYAYNTTASTTVDVARKTVTVTGSGVDKTYDGSTSVGVVLGSDGIVSGDTVAFSGAGTMADKNAGTAKSVAVSDIGASGADAANYAYNTTASTTVDVSKKTVLLTSTAIDRIYDGSAGVGVDVSTTGLVEGDSVSFSGTGTMADKTAGNGKAVAVSGIAAAGTDAANYAYATTGSTTVNVAKKVISVTGNGVDRTYDGTTGVAVALASDGIVSGDTVAFTGTGTMADKTAGTDKSVAIGNIAESGTDAGNYSLENTTAAGSVNIAKKVITVTGNGVDKTYDGTTGVGVALASAGIVSGDTVAFSGTGTMADKMAGTGKSVAIGSIAESGSDASNYTLANTTATGTVNVAKKTVTVTSTGQEKSYDGSTAVGVTVSADGILSGDTVAFTGQGTAADKNAGVNKAVSVAISASGADVGNYAYASTGATTATIDPAKLNVSLVAPIKKTNDGTTSVALTGANYAITGVISGESMTLPVTTGQFPDNISGKDKTVSVSLTSASYVAGANTSLANYQLVTGPLSANFGEIVDATNPAYDAAKSSVPSNPAGSGVGTSTFQVVFGSNAPATSTGSSDNGVSTQNGNSLDGGIASMQTHEALSYRRGFSIADGGIKLPNGVSDTDSSDADPSTSH